MAGYGLWAQRRFISRRRRFELLSQLTASQALMPRAETSSNLMLTFWWKTSAARALSEDESEVLYSNGADPSSLRRDLVRSWHAEHARTRRAHAQAFLEVLAGLPHCTVAVHEAAITPEMRSEQASISEHYDLCVHPTGWVLRDVPEVFAWAMSERHHGAVVVLEGEMLECPEEVMGIALGLWEPPRSAVQTFFTNQSSRRGWPLMQAEVQASLRSCIDLAADALTTV